MLVLRIGLFAGLAVALAGCSQSGAASKVTGKITYKGQTVKAGDVYFWFEQGGQYNTAIKSDGSYQFMGLPTGNAKVLIETETFNPDQKPPSYTQQGKQIARGMGKGFADYNATVGKGEKAGEEKKAGSASVALTKEQKEALAKVYVKIPRKYASEKTTPLSFTVASGSQTKDFDLTD
jgi:hypothetical protein